MAGRETTIGSDSGSGTRRLLDLIKSMLYGDGDRSRSGRDAIVAFTVRVLSAGILYLSQVVLARWMGGFEYGIFVLVWTWVLLLGGMASLGLNTSVMRFASEYASRREVSRSVGLLAGSAAVALTGGTILAAGGLLTLWLLSGIIEDHFLVPAVLGAVCIPLYALTDVQDGIGRGRGWLALALVPPYILRPLLLLAAALMAQFMGLPLTASTAVAAAIVATWLTGIVQSVPIWRRTLSSVSSRRPSFEFRHWLTVSLPLWLIVGCELIVQYTDVLVVSRYMAPTDVAIYFAAAKTISLIMFVHYAVGSAMAHRFAALKASGDEAGLRAVVRDSVNWTFWPSLVGGLVLLCLGRPLLWLFGSEFTAGYPIMFVLVIGYLLRSAVGPADYLLNMLGQQKLSALILLAAAAVNIILNFTLVPTMGLLGAASATASALVLQAILSAFAVRRALGLDVFIWRNAAWAAPTR